MNNNFNQENISKIIKWKEYVDNGHYGSSKDIVDTYNEVFDGIKQKQPYTSCGSCLRRCVMTMFNAYQEYKAELNNEIKEAVDEVKDGNADAVIEEIKGLEVVVDENSGATITKRSVGRPKKS